MVKDEYAVKEVEVQDARHKTQVQGSRKQSHEPFVHILLRLDVFHFQVLTQIRQVVLEYLFEQLKYLSDLTFIKAVEGHNRIFSDHVAEGYECLMFIHIQQ